MVIHNASGFADAVYDVNISDGGKRDRNNLLSCPHLSSAGSCDLRPGLVPL